MIYWAAATLVLSLVLTSVMGSFASSFLISTMLMPGILSIKYFSKNINFADRRKGITGVAYCLAIFILTEFLAVMAFVWFTDKADPLNYNGLLTNPIFLCFILISLLSIEELIKMKFLSPPPEEKRVTFTSERKKVSLDVDDILLIESKDSEVSVRTVSGKTYTTKMKISQWEAVLDDRFVRVHRSFIVNRRHITTFGSKAVYLGELCVEISRKYKESVMNRLDGTGVPDRRTSR